MKTNRRSFLGQSAAVTLGALPSLVCRGASAAEGSNANSDGRKLVVIQMSGGNDGINTVVPFSDPGYAKFRRELQLPTDRLIKIDDAIALHPSMRSAADLLEDGKLSIVQGVGYPNPSRSHDTSMAIWHSAKLGDENTLRTHGWLGKAMDSMREREDQANGNDPDMVLLGDESQPLAIQSRRSSAVTLSSLTDLRLSRPYAQGEELEQSDLVSAPLGRFVQQTMRNATATASVLERAIQQSDAGKFAYPTSQLGQRMQTISTLIKSGFATPVYYAIQSGYDTHSAQLNTHSRLLREFGDSVKAFLDDLESAGLSNEVCVLGFSEFGRRVAENGSAGTDHGTAGPVFLAGTKVRPGLVGAAPNLLDLVDGDVRMNIDFRRVYQEITESWFGVNGEQSDRPSPIPLSLFAV